MHRNENKYVSPIQNRRLKSKWKHKHDYIAKIHIWSIFELPTPPSHGIKTKIMTKWSNLRFRRKISIINNPKSLNGMLPRFDKQEEMMHYSGHPRPVGLDFRMP